MSAVFILLVAVWGGAQAIFSWIAFNEGITSVILPIWNSAFDLALVAIAVGVVRKQRWARDWGIGISVLNGVNNGYAGVAHNAPLLWIGVIVQVGAAIVLLATRKELWVDLTPKMARVSQALSAVALVGSFAVPLVMGGQGSEQGRRAPRRGLSALLPSR